MDESGGVTTDSNKTQSIVGNPWKAYTPKG